MSIAAEQALFDACLAAPNAAERERLLDSHPDADVSARVRRLLAREASDADALVASPLQQIASPVQVGAFRILERLGEGAIGEVFLAEQQQPVRRRVALKILKFGLGTREVMARFELERQTLALMTHPNIARILDAGATPDGRPYFAMEYVPGVALTRYCDERRLPLADRLALFEEICAGVQHAHLRGVIHRDLKPSNILVAEVDGRPLPKIIDFGIAKATSALPTEEDAYTRVGQLLGTPEYMSPEQVQLSPLEIDARTDVYSLGVLLYELLCGVRPYEVTRDSLDPSVIAREIREGQVAKPSQRVAAAPGPEVALARSTTLRQLCHALRGDLDWIALKALEKDRQRRYVSVAELASDLERARTSQPVTAGPPSALYVLGRWVRRHRLVAAVLTTVFAAALLFGSGMGVLAHRASVERDRANRQAAVAQRVTAFTASLFAGAGPTNAGNGPASARDLLDAGVKRLESELLQEPENIQAALLQAAADAYRGLGEYARAEPLIERAVALLSSTRGSSSAARARALHSQAALAHARGDYIQAEARLREAVRDLQRTGLPDRGELFDVRLELALILRLRSQLEEAERGAADLVKEADSAVPRNTGQLARALDVLGQIGVARGNVAQSLPLLERSLALHRQAFGDADPRTFEAKASLAAALVTLDDSPKAEPLLREVVEDARRLYGPRHPQVAIALNNLGNAVSDLEGRLADAESAYRESVDLLRSGGSGSAVELASSLNNLCSLYLKEKRWEPARDACAEATALRTSSLGPDHPETAGSQLGEALALNRLEDYRGAESLLRAAIATFTAQLGANHWRVGNAQTYLGMVLANQKRPAEAAVVLRQAERKLLAAFGPDHSRTKAARTALAELRSAR